MNRSSHLRQAAKSYRQNALIDPLFRKGPLDRLLATRLSTIGRTICGWGLLCGVVACSGADDNSADSEESESEEIGMDDGGSDTPEFLPPAVDRRYVAMNIMEGGVERLLIKDSIIKLEFDLGNRIWALGFCSRMEGTWQIVDQRLAFTMLRYMDVDKSCPIAKKQQDDWFFNFMLSTPLLTGDAYVFLVDNGIIQMEFFRTYRGD